MPFFKRSIEKVFNRDTGKDENASSIFRRFSDKDEYVRLRRLLRLRNKQNNSLYQCNECGTELELSCMPDGDGEHTFYFKHIRDPLFTNCSIKTDSNLSQEEILRKQYAFKSESNAHLILKQKVGEVIKRFIYPEVIIDKKFINDRFGDKEKRKPDIYFKFNDKEITIEFQVNNTFHSIIQEREAFYERNLISLMWVFGDFNPDAFQSITIKDMYIPNGNNAFVFDTDAEQASYVQQTLCLKVFYKKYSISRDESIVFEWVNEILSLDKIKFNTKTFRPYYFDCIADKEKTEKELEIIQRNREIELLESEAYKKIKDIKDFLTRYKNNDHTYSVPYSEKINTLSVFETEKLNTELHLNNTFKDGNNVIQVLLNEGGHLGLIIFLLSTYKIELSLFSTNIKNETTLISILKSEKHPDYALQLLFSRLYKLTEFDEDYIRSHYHGLEQKRLLYIFNAYEKLADYDKISYFYDNVNKFLVIDSAKIGKLNIIGNEKQSLLWMVNLVVDKYKSLWYYFDMAFTFYNFYDKIFKSDQQGTFKKGFDSLKLLSHPKNIEFEGILALLYPELFHTQNST